MESKGPVVIPVKDPEVNYLNKSFGITCKKRKVHSHF